MTLVLPQSKQRDMRFRPRVQYEHPGLGDDKEADTSKAKMEIATARWVGAKLDQHFAGHAWNVEVICGRHGRDGVIKIRLNGIMPAKGWFVVKLSETLTDPGGRTILRGAGELLERYGIRRGNFNLDDWRNALNAMPLSVRKLGRGHVAPLLD